MMWFKTLISLILPVSTMSITKTDHLDYCIIGAGPAGIQLGYYLHKAGRNYIIYEKSGFAGSFFSTYPRHRTLISINKRNTGSTNKEFNMRHDWNSLLSDNENLLFRHYSKEMFPGADIMVRYLSDFADFYNLNIQYNTEMSIDLHKKNGYLLLTDQNNHVNRCRIVIIATGIWIPNVPNVPGIELSVGYENISTDPEHYEAKSVLILGRGNSAFETASSVYEKTNFVHMVGRQRIRLAWETHYVGDLRAVNNQLLDTYQLKSLDGLLEFDDITDYRIIEKKGKLYLRDHDDADDIWSNYDNDPLLMPYDYIIRCLGFKFDNSIFKNDSLLSQGRGRLKKFPVILDDYQSVDVEDVYFTGVNTHSLDYRVSAGGFIHGFRYTVRSLHRILSWRYHSEVWPHVTLSVDQIVTTIVKRLSETSGLYQMFSFLVDVVVFERENKEFAYFEEFPIKLLPTFEKTTGYNTSGKNVLIIILEYGDGYHGPTEDVFRMDRATTSARWAHLSNFLHPVLYYYDKDSADFSLVGKYKDNILPRPTRLHHMVEDFNTVWYHPYTHIEPLTVFIENCLQSDLQLYSNKECFVHSISNSIIPINCLQYVQANTMFTLKKTKF